MLQNVEQKLRRQHLLSALVTVTFFPTEFNSASRTLPSNMSCKPGITIKLPTPRAQDSLVLSQERLNQLNQFRWNVVQNLLHHVLLRHVQL
jgi:hypothetical protein